MGGSVFVRSAFAAQERTRPVLADPTVDAVSRELFAAVRARPDAETVKRAVLAFVAVAETTGYAARIDALLQQPGMAQRAFVALNDHATHEADRARLLAAAPEMVYQPVPAMPTRTMDDVARATAFFRQHGFAGAARQMAEGLSDPARLDWCDNWGFMCLLWGYMTVLVCLIPAPWGCLLWIWTDVAICTWWFHCTLRD